MKRADLTTPGGRLKHARMQAGYRTAKEFADKHDVPQPTYANHENNKRGLKQDTAADYARALGNCSPGWILTGEGIGPDNGSQKSDITIEQVEDRLPPTAKVIPLGLRDTETAPVSPDFAPLLADGTPLADAVLPHRSDAYWLRVRTRDMAGRGILPGDLVLIDPRAKPEPGALVAAQVVDDRHGTAQTVVRAFHAGIIESEPTQGPGTQIAIGIHGGLTVGIAGVAVYLHRPVP